MEESSKGSGDENFRTRAQYRKKLLTKVYHLMVDDWPEEDRGSVQLNSQLVTAVSESYFKDLDRKKEFHGIKYADAHKRAGYMAKWIMRYRPVQITSDQCSVRALLANEHFAILMALKFIKVSPGKVSVHLYKNLLYTMRYRHLDGNALALAFYLLERAARADGLI